MRPTIFISMCLLLAALAVHAPADDSNPPVPTRTPESEDSAASLFAARCAMCHPNGGNRFYPYMPLVGSPQLKDFSTFLTFIRHPTLPDGAMGPMPPITESLVSEGQAKDLFAYLNKELPRWAQGGARSPQTPPGYGAPGYGMGPGMMGPGYGMGPGMMGRGYGMGPGMMGRGYGMGPGMMGGGYGMGPGMMGPGYGAPPGYPGYGGPYHGRPSAPLDKEGARQQVQAFLEGMHNPNLKVGKITDKGTYFEVRIVTRENSLVDKINVNKRTGFMHSTY
jgi:cytochrome c553